MGSLCVQKGVALEQRPDLEKQQIRVTAIDALKQINFSFTTEKLIHVQADLLLLIMDNSLNIRKNDHFQKLPTQGAKLEEHLKAHLAHKRQRANFATFNIIIPTLNFSRVSILFCEIWKEGQHNDSQFREVLREYFDSIAEQNVKSMVITEPGSELGAHLQKAVRRILREIVRMANKPERIEFCCLSEQSRQIFAGGVEENRQDLQKSFGSVSQNDGSVYY